MDDNRTNPRYSAIINRIGGTTYIIKQRYIINVDLGSSSYHRNLIIRTKPVGVDRNPLPVIGED